MHILKDFLGHKTDVHEYKHWMEGILEKTENVFLFANPQEIVPSSSLNFLT